MNDSTKPNLNLSDDNQLADATLIVASVDDVVIVPRGERPPETEAHANKRLISQEKQDEREAWHKLVVKVITWRDGLFEGGMIKSSDKITPAEWIAYTKGVLKINTSAKVEKIKANLEEIKQKITKNGGFEEKKSK